LFTRKPRQSEAQSGRNPKDGVRGPQAGRDLPRWPEDQLGRIPEFAVSLPEQRFF